MDHSDDAKRMGRIRVNESLWTSHEQAIRIALGTDSIRHAEKAVEGGQYIKGVDIILNHPEFDVTESEELPLYDCHITPSPDGSVTIGRIIRKQQC